MNRLLRLAALILALLAIPAMAPQAASAQQARPRAVPASLTEVLLVSESANESKFRLAFAPRANTFAPVGSDLATPSLGLALTTRGVAAVSPPGLSGLVRQISFEQVESVLIIHFSTAAPATVKAVVVSDTTIEVTVSTGVKVARRNEVQLQNGPLPQASDPTPGEDGYELVMLKYADVSEIVGLLTDGQTVKSNDTFIPREPAFGSNSLTGGASYNPGPTNQYNGNDGQPLGQSVDSRIGIDRRLNAIWIKGTPEQIARTKRQIALIDQPVDSVILETEIVELTESGAKAVGIDFANANGQIAVATFQSGQYIPPGEIPTGGGHFQYPRDANGNGGSFVGGNFTSVSLQAAVYAQVSKGEGKIVSKPRIAAQSGSTAKIITGDALPILTAITLSGVNGVSQQVQYVNVGVTLQIAPRISSDGFVTSHVFCVVSSVSGFSQGYPTISQREAETSATVGDGDSFVIGGLTQDSTIKSQSKVPILGDIPLLGQAFRTDRKTKSRTELYIIVTPHVVRRSQPTAPLSAPTAAVPTTELPPAPRP
jgi:general secretion pathway protein D